MIIPHRDVFPHRRILIAILFTTAMMVASSLVAIAQSGQEATPSPDDTACVVASPQATNGTPAAIPASPPPLDPTVDNAPELGTPVALPCLTVTLIADNALAGPLRLTVELNDEDGMPVTGAKVVILTRHLGMDHGTSVNETVEADPGIYTVEQVPMGMGGTWQADVVITRPGYEPFTLTFFVDLEGPE